MILVVSHVDTARLSEEVPDLPYVLAPTPLDHAAVLLTILEDIGLETESEVRQLLSDEHAVTLVALKESDSLPDDVDQLEQVVGVLIATVERTRGKLGRVCRILRIAADEDEPDESLLRVWLVEELKKLRGVLRFNAISMVVGEESWQTRGELAEADFAVDKQKGRRIRMVWRPDDRKGDDPRDRAA